ncbi:MAG: hypothetical protein V3V81_08135 [Candidatus Bathyarchaeia archaeon]
MANSIYGKVWIIDTIGIITRNPITIKALVMFPNSAADTASLYYWDESDTISAGVGSEPEIDGDITGNDTLTLDSGTSLPSTITDGSIFEIVKSTGSSDNVGKPMLVQTAGNNTAVVIHKIPAADQWTNETNKRYGWKTYQNRLAFNLISSAQKDMPVIPFGSRGHKFPNLALETITSATNTKIYLYLE